MDDPDEVDDPFLVCFNNHSDTDTGIESSYLEIRLIFLILVRSYCV